MNENPDPKGRGTGRSIRSVRTAPGAAALLLTILLGTGCGESERGDPLTKAQQHIAAGEHAAAVIELKNALQRDPSQDAARWLLAKNYLLFGEGLNAEKALARIEERHGDETEFKIDLARSLILQTRFDDVLAEFESADKPVQDPTLLALMAIAKVGTRDYAGATALAESAREAAPNNADVLIASATAAYANGDPTAAFAFLDTAKLSAPENVEPYIVEARIAQSLQDFARAEAALTKATEIPPRRIDVHRELALALVSQGRAEAALKELEPLLLRVPDDPRSLLMRAQARLQLGDEEAGKDDLRLVVGKYPNYLPARFMLARVLLGEGLLGQAEDLVRAVVERTPEHLEARMLLAQILVGSGKAGEAVALVEGDYDYDESDPRVLEFIGTVYGRAGRVEQSRNYLRRAASAAPDNETVKVKVALAEIASGDFDVAMRYLEALGPDTRSGEALKLLVTLQRDELDETIALADKLLQQDPDQAWVNFMLGNARLKKSEVDAAEAAYRRAVDIDPTFSAAMINLASIAEYREQYGKAAEWLEKANAVDPDNEKILVPLSVARARAGDAEGAVSSLNILSNRYPQAPLPRFALSQIHLAAQEFGAARSRAREAAALAPADPRIAANLARIELAAGNSREAVTILTGPILGANESDEIRFVRAIAFQAQGDIGRAREELTKIVAGGEPSVSVLIAQAHLEARAGEQGKALAAARKIEAQFPDAPEGYALEGDLLAAAGDLPGAERAFGTALQKGGGVNVMVRQFKLLVRAERRDEAIRFAENWVEKSSKNPQELYTLAVAYAEVGENQKAIAVYEQLASRPDVHASVFNNLAWLYLETGDQRALETAQRAHELRPDSPGVADTLGWIMVNQGKADLALKHLRAAVDGLPGSPSARYHLGVALARNGNKADAKEALEAALSLGDFAEKDKALRLVDTL